MPTSADFRTALHEIFDEAYRRGEKFVVVKAKDLHVRVGGYPGPQARMPVCCGAMRKEMQDGDTIIEQPKSGQGASLTVRYQLPRTQMGTDPGSPSALVQPTPASTKIHQTPTLEDLAKARHLFEHNEPRDLFYRVATELVRLALENPDHLRLSLHEALAVLLQTWNAAYYRYRKFDADHFRELEMVLNAQRASALNFRSRELESLKEEDIPIVGQVYCAFENLLHPVGAVKVLHLLAPRFFPLWDQKIAAAYGCRLRPKSSNVECYILFMKKIRDECTQLVASLPRETNVLKAIDELNYCRYTKKWM